jgi:putative transposase
VRRTVPPSAEIEEQIDRLLAVGVGDNPRESLSELARLGARLIIQRAVEDEFDAWLGRARYQRRPGYQRGLRNYDSGLRNGFRPRRVQTLEGELEVEISPIREAAEPFVSKLFCVQHEGVAHRAASGDGDRRVRQGAVDARQDEARRVAVTSRSQTSAG